MFLDSKAPRSHRIARILTLHHPTFLLGWAKTQPERRGENGEDELYEAVDEILPGLSIEMIQTVFVDWNPRQRLIDGNGGYISENITSEFLN
jgi:hypothetical protein